jgi:hypothetical protein
MESALVGREDAPKIRLRSGRGGKCSGDEVGDHPLDEGGQSPGPVTAACTVELSDGSFDQAVKRFDQGTHNTAAPGAQARRAACGGQGRLDARVKQLNGEWKTKNPALQSLQMQAEELLAQFESSRVEWIPRKENRRVDELGRA